MSARLCDILDQLQTVHNNILYLSKSTKEDISTSRITAAMPQILGTEQVSLLQAVIVLSFHLQMGVNGFWHESSTVAT